MEVASFELCKELFELSGWTGSVYAWELHTKHNFLIHTLEYDKKPSDKEWIAAYDLGYLLRKLPSVKDVEFRIEQNGFSEQGQDWVAYGYDYKVFEDTQNEDKARIYRNNADTPEDAVCALAIALFKQGVLTHD